MEKPSLAKNSIFNVVYQLVLVLVPLITAMYASRVILPDALGEISIANNYVSYFTTLAPLGIAAYGVREIAKCSSDKAELSRVFTELFIINAVSTIIFLVAYAISLLIIFGSFVPTLYLIFGTLIVANSMNIEWFYQGIERFDFISIRGTCVRIVCLILTVVLVKTPQDIFLYAGITCLGTVANYLVNCFCLKGKVRLSLCGVRPLRHMKRVLVLAGTNLLFSLYTKIDISMMGMMCSSACVAFYVYAYNAEEIAKTLCTSVTNVYLPRLSYEFSFNRVEFDRLISQSMLLNLFFAFPMAIGVFILAPQIISILFGAAFLPAATTLRIFSILVIAKSVGNVFYQATIATGNEKFQLVAYTVGVFFNVALNAVLIPLYAQNGAVIATIVTEVALDLALVAFIKKYLNIHIGRKFLLSLAISLVVMACSVMACCLLISNDVVCLIVAIISAVASYAVAMIATKNEVAVLLVEALRGALKW